MKVARTTLVAFPFVVAIGCGAQLDHSAGGTAGTGGAGRTSASSTGAGVAGTTGTGGVTGAAGTTDAGGLCTDLLNDSAPAPVTFHSGDRPADALGAGGVIVDGVYGLVSTDIYRSSDADPPASEVTTIRISNGGTRMEYVSGFGEDGGADNPAVAFVRTLAVSGTTVTETETCRFLGGLQPPVTEDFTATPTTFMLANNLYVNRYRLR